MKKKIGIFSDFAKNSGGAFHEASYLAKSIIENFSEKYEFIIITPHKDQLDLGDLNIKHLNFSLGAVNRYLHFCMNFSPMIRRLKKFNIIKNKFEKFITENDIDLIFFPGPSQYSMYLENTDFIITVPDVCHRENVEIPEWTKNGEFIRREEVLKNSLPRSIATITNSNSIKNNLVNFYGLYKDRVFVINQQPSKFIKDFSEDEKIKNEFNNTFKLPNNYLFYPAMYLPQKNHKYIIDCLEILKNKYSIDLNAVFCGVDKGYLSILKSYVEKKKLTKKVFFYSFVESKFLPYFYLYSFALAMPTLSGPTNLPVWEGFKMKKLVFYSNLPHAKEIYGDGPSYIDPLDPESMSAKIYYYVNNINFKEKKILKGVEQSKNNKFKDEIKIFEKIFKNYFDTLKIWNFN